MSILKLTCVLVVLLVVVAAAVASGAAPAKAVGEEHPGLATGALTHARLADLPAGVLIRSGQIKMTLKNVNERLSLFPPHMLSKVKEDSFYVLEDAMGEALLYSEAYDWSLKSKVSEKTRGDLVAAYLDTIAQSVTATDAEVQQFYEDNAADLNGTPLSEIREDIKKGVEDAKRMQAAAAYMTTLGMAYDIEVDRKWAAEQYKKAMNNPVEKARRAGKPLLVDFGSIDCGPCRRLSPILNELKKEYAGRMDVLVIDVDKEPLLGSRYGASAIPLQIFYDKTGKEVFRHAGFYSKASIVAKLADIGVK